MAWSVECVLMHANAVRFRLAVGLGAVCGRFLFYCLFADTCRSTKVGGDRLPRLCGTISEIIHLGWRDYDL